MTNVTEALLVAQVKDQVPLIHSRRQEKALLVDLDHVH
jgi:hypothetical protein